MATKQTELKDKILSELPALTGSEKQIAWAEKIRQAWVGDMKALFQMVANRNYPSTKMPSVEELRKLAEKHDQTSAPGGLTTGVALLLDREAINNG